MKKYLTAVLLGIGIISLPSLAGEDMKEFIKKKGCFACHDISRQKSGPPFKAVAKEYKGKPDAVKTLVTSITSGSMGKWQGLSKKYGFKVNMMYMPRQHVTKEEAEKIVKYILSLEK
ncbi:MAG TPA: flagellar biosynthesis protein FlgI [Persephonella sp.]|uniref:CytoChrome c-552 (Cytochrome c552) n=1 Tax=Persephonella marina (strain DSM 14350 / EX-H1) TaxID=123214 RepID=C0QQT3_PERMH|nr:MULTISPECIES: c-type cytochrome [Persephonella]ACO04298.1 cytoChrome c-552 (Cytochrome c552) [Persephonella marina EX-H1]HCB68779.1 flagellar biosynthesis protein FlgI [Persephonella sp.]